MKHLSAKRVRAYGSALALVAGSVGSAVCAYADTVDDPVTRSRPDFDAQGIPLGAFRLFPSLTAGTTYDDNIHRQERNTLSDAFFTISPAAVLRSQWSQHALNLSASSDSLLYSKYSSENITNYTFSGDGRLDVLRSFRIIGSASYAQLHVLRSAADSPDTTNPLPFSDTHADVTAEYQPADLGISVGVTFDHFDYGTAALVGGSFTDWADQNRDVIVPHARVSYQFSPGYSAFVEGLYDERNFDLPVDRSGFDRSSHGYRVRGGLGAPLSHLIQGAVFLGYLNQEYPAPLPNVSGLDFGANVDWYITQLTTIRLAAARLVNDTTFAGVSAMDDETVRISVDHELLRNLILHGTVGYTASHFRGISRDDSIVDAGFGADYLVNPYLSAGARYTHESRDSSEIGQGFGDNIFTVAITGHL